MITIQGLKVFQDIVDEIYGKNKYIIIQGE